jgi:hypothetical protein
MNWTLLCKTRIRLWAATGCYVQGQQQLLLTFLRASFAASFAAFSAAR